MEKIHVDLANHAREALQIRNARSSRYFSY